MSVIRDLRQLTMFCKVVVKCSFLWYFFGTVTSQCAPEPVTFFTLNNTVLSWGNSSTCENTTYIITIIFRNSGSIEYAEHFEGHTLDVSFLPLCKPYIFTVSPVSNYIVGPNTYMSDAIPLPEDGVITIANFTGSQIDRDVVLEWSANSEYLYCPDSYRILLWDEDSTEPEEINTNHNSYTILSVAQCMSYQVEISVVYREVEHPVSKFNYTVPATTNFPSLQAVTVGDVIISTTWSLESYDVNRCNVTALHVSGSALNTTIPILDVPKRPSIEVIIGDLKANSMYYINVTVENSAGISRPFQLAAQTLPV